MKYLLIALTAVLCFAQTEPRIVVDTTLVVIPVTVTDPSNRFVLGLEKEDFAVFEDGVEQKITHFSGEDAPLSVGLIVDTSGSMGLKMDTSHSAVT
jgi:Ca-activated chloride channel family protein